MKSLFYELSSSLNVELVYVILKSITQFACREYTCALGFESEEGFPILVSAIFDNIVVFKCDGRFVALVCGL